MTVNHEDEPTSLRKPAAVVADYLRGSISVSHLLDLAWTGRLFIVATTIIGLLYGVYTVHENGPSFLASMRIAPADGDSSFGDAGGASGASGLLAGLTGGGGTAALPKFTQFLMAMGTEGVAEDLDRKYDLLCRIYRRDCDQVTHRWKERTGIQEWFNGMLARLAGLPDPNGPRTIMDLAHYVGASISTDLNKTNSMVTIEYVNREPVFAAQFLTAVAKASNDYVRAQSRETQKRYVEYLTDSAAKTTNVEQRTAIDTLLLQEERQLMMTEVDAPYAAKYLEQPVVTPVNDALKTIAIRGVVGLVVGIFLALSRNLIPRKWRLW
jgi:hypothetical protein